MPHPYLCIVSLSVLYPHLFPMHVCLSEVSQSLCIRAVPEPSFNLICSRSISCQLRYQSEESHEICKRIQLIHTSTLDPWPSSTYNWGLVLLKKHPPLLPTLDQLCPSLTPTSDTHHSPLQSSGGGPMRASARSRVSLKRNSVLFYHKLPQGERPT